MDGNKDTVPQGEDEHMDESIESIGEPTNHGEAAPGDSSLNDVEVEATSTLAEEPAVSTEEESIQILLGSPQPASASVIYQADIEDIEGATAASERCKIKLSVLVSHEAAEQAKIAIQKLEQSVVEPAQSATLSTPDVYSIKDATMQAMKIIEYAINLNKQIIQMHEKKAALQKDNETVLITLTSREKGVVPERPATISEPGVVPERPATISEPGVVPERPATISEPGVVPERPATISEPGVVPERPATISEPGVSEPGVVPERPETAFEPTVDSDSKIGDAVWKCRVAVNFCRVALPILQDPINMLSRYDAITARIQTQYDIDPSQRASTSTDTTSVGVAAQPSGFPAQKKLKLDPSQALVKPPCTPGCSKHDIVFQFKLETLKAVNIIKRAVEAIEEAHRLFQEVAEMTGLGRIPDSYLDPEARSLFTGLEVISFYAGSCHADTITVYKHGKPEE